MPEKALILPPLRRTAADAARFAAVVHEGQVDQVGSPYIQHLRAVACEVRDLSIGCPFWDAEDVDLAEQIAWLHDLIEDTDVTPQVLEREGFSQAVVSGVMRITRQSRTMPYSVLIASIAGHDDLHPILVKLADVEDNSDPERLALLPEETRARLLRKYEPAKEVLRAAARQKGWMG